VASATEIGGDVVAAGAAIGGLMLVYMGALSTSFSTYEPSEKRSAGPSFRRRIWFAFAGLAFNVLAIPFGLAAKALDCPCALWTSLALLALGLAWLIVVAILSALEIK
jgi:hypothetical protein